jgi:hypothetical protein
MGGPLIAKQKKPLHYLLGIPLYTLIFVSVSYVLNVLGHRFGWRDWVGTPFNFGRTFLVAIFWSVAMVAVNYWRLRKRVTT